MANKQKPETATNEVATVTEPTVPEPNPKRPRKPKTLADVFAGYVAELEDRGASPGTIASYRMELALAAKALGADTSLSSLTDTAITAFFESMPVTRKRNGKPKSPLSADKTRRVLRQALVWAGHADLVPTMEVAP